MTVDVGVVLSATATVLVVLAAVGVVLALTTDDREPSIVLAWLFVILLVPVLGVVAYFFLGRNHRDGSRGQTRVRAEVPPGGGHAPLQALAAEGPFGEALAERLDGTAGERLLSVGRTEGGAVPLPATDVRLYVTGSEKFADLMDDIRGARHHVHLMYLIWEQDALTAEVTAALHERLDAGVEVRILYDWLTSLPYRKAELRALARAGATVVPCYRRASQLNYRNHMKIALVDGVVAYSGGMNMGQEYIDGGPRFAEWRDTHLRMTGPVVAAYVRLFADTWSLNGREEDLATGYLPAEAGEPPPCAMPVQVVQSSVSTDFPAIRDLFVAALLGARRRVWIQSPYFVPDDALLTAMCVAATAGVDVRLMMTGVPDKKLPFHAAHAYYPRLLRSGVRVLQYRAGFLHAKTVTVDDDVAIVGTCNWDIRSLILHDEVVAVLYDEPFAAACAKQYELDLARCDEVTEESLSELGARQRLRNSVARLFSRLL